MYVTLISQSIPINDLVFILLVIGAGILANGNNVWIINLYRSICDIQYVMQTKGAIPNNKEAMIGNPLPMDLDYLLTIC